MYGGHFIGFNDEQAATAKPEWLNANGLGARLSNQPSAGPDRLKRRASVPAQNEQILRTYLRRHSIRIGQS